MSFCDILCLFMLLYVFQLSILSYTQPKLNRILYTFQKYKYAIYDDICRFLKVYNDILHAI